MSTYHTLLFLISSALSLDFCLGLIQSTHNKDEKRMSKGPGLLIRFLLATNQSNILESKKTLLKKFFISLGALFCFVSATIYMLLADIEPQNTGKFIICICPLFLAPYYHLFFSLNSENPRFVFSSLNIFNIRSFAYLNIGFNLAFSNTYKTNIFVPQFFHLLFCLVSLGHIILLASQTREPSSPRLYISEDISYGPTGFLNYLCKLFEITYCLILIKTYLTIDYLTQIFLINDPTIKFYLLILLMSLGALVTAKLFFIQNSSPKVNLYQKTLMPVSFILFGLVFLYQT